MKRNAALSLLLALTLTLQLAPAASAVGPAAAAPAAAVPAEINAETVWRYLDDGSDPAAGLTDRTDWADPTYNDSGWETAKGSFGAKNGAIADLGGGCTPDNLLDQYKDGGTEDKEAFFDAYDTLCKCLPTFTEMLRTTTFRADVMRRSAGLGFTNATDLADYLVGKGVPFRDAHHVSGSLVGKCVHEGRALEDLSLEELRAAHPAFDEDVYQAISLEACVERRSLQGGPAPQAVSASIKRLDRWLDAHADGAEA